MGTFKNLFFVFFCSQVFNSIQCQVLNPPLFNLAENKKIKATATCGELNGRPLKEMFCFLAGATAYNPFIGIYTYSSEQDQYFAELRIGGDRSDQKNVVEGGQNCEFCDSSNPDLSHPAEYMVDGTPRWWQSPPLSRGMEYNQVNITLDLEQEFHVAYVSITMANSPRPGLWVLERSTDYGKTYRPWQYFAENPSQCEEFFGPDALQPILDDDNVVCSTEYSQIVPLENGEIIITLLNNRPSRSNFSHSEKLQKFTQATNVRIRLLRTKTLQGHLMDLNDKKDPSITRRYFYAIKEIEMGGRCVCNGHAKTCDILDQYRSNRLLCRCEHNTCGDQCEKCCSGFEQKQWHPTREGRVFECEPCNCFGHSEDCQYDKSVDEQHLSMDIKGNHVGGGVCKNCRDNTDGINCNKCTFGFYRPYDRPLNASNVCQPCTCHPHYHTGGCAEGNGQCECRPNFLAPDCRACAKGFYDYPECKPCDCNINGTSGEVCLPEDGKCPCKPNYGGMFCDQCIDGTYKFPDCIECKCEDLGASDKNCSKTNGQCNCKLNYGGKGCELCADGYYDHPKCLYCNCDPSGTEKDICDKTSGVCFCKPGYSGERCDQCNATFYGYPECKPCLCDLLGSTTESCQTSTTGQCSCKPNFTGRRCNKCSAGYYDYPKCLACDCDRSGSRGITCNDNGLCYCKPNFDGTKCNRCKPNFYNYPICEECNCDPRGVSSTFLGCDRVPPGELCSCKERVTGRICNECKPTFWNLQYFNRLGCDDCGCNLPGTLSGLSDCNDVSGQCQCKAHVSGRNCTDCKTGFFNLQSLNQFGCQPCSCDIGGSFSAICDAKTGQCRCKPRINGRNCTGPIDMHYFPTLLHMQFEAEDGRTVDHQRVRFAIDSEAFPNFSWRGFAVFSPIQDEIVLDIDIVNPTLYRLILRYVNPTANDVTATAEFVPTYSYHQDDIKQTVEFKLPPTKEPKTFVISKNGSPYPFVLNPGRWALHLKTQQRLYLDYVALFPAAYYEGSVLRQDVRNPCNLDLTAGSCKRYVYPTIDHPRTTIGGMYLQENGAKKSVQAHLNEQVIEKHGQVALVEGNATYVVEIGLKKPGNYVVVIDYANFIADVFPVEVEIKGDQDAKFMGVVTFHHCPYGEFCREVVSRDGQPLNVLTNGNSATVSIIPSSQTNIALGAVVAIPFDEWKVDYLIPKTHCIMRNGKCHGSDYLFPPNSLRFDIETHANQNLSIFAENLPFEVADDKMAAVVLNSDQPSVEINGKVTSPGSYVFVVHYYNPKFASFDVEALVQNERLYKTSNITFANAIIPISFCPSVSGCRTIIQRKEDNAKSFTINDQFTVTLFLKNVDQRVYMDYILTVPLDNYGEDVLEPISGERSAEFLTKCSNLLLETNPEKFDAYCKNRVFSLTADYNQGAFRCGCNIDGSTDLKCDSFGGQCPCKPNVIGKQCSMCGPGFFGFPDCKPCKCLRQQQCDPDSGQCFCPLHVEGQQCDVCKQYAFGYDPLIGCQECKCNSQGTIGGTSDCDQLNGQCKCTEKVGGRKCDKCLAGFYGFPHCYQCSCELAGSSPEICDQNNAQCSCKENVRGQSCESCTYGTFHLEERNPKGCTECFCFGVTNQCTSAELVKHSIADMKGWTVINGVVTDLTEVPSGVEFTATGDGVGPVAPHKAIYFVAPSPYLGKLLYSYGGKMTYIVSSHPADANSYRATAPDVILKSHNETLEHWADEIPADPAQDFHMSVDFLPEKWRKEGGSFVSRPLLMMTLNQVSAIYLKASYFDRINKARISRVFLDSATEDRNRVGNHAMNVESCYCPAGYNGSSCEECSDGYYRVQGHSGISSLGSCVPCQCNGHSGKCDKITGQCFDCQHDTHGEHCELCSIGYHGDPTRGHPMDCQLCACPHPTLDNNFATSCSVAESGHVRSCHCKPGYSGSKCERCDIGFFGDPMRHMDKCQPCFCNENNNLTIPAACNPYSGVCSLCERNTMGNACEICASWYYGDAVSQKNCRECSCNKCNSHLCEHDTGLCRCKPNVEGESCDRCVANGWDFKSCHGCRMCNCGLASTSTQCDHDSGKCSCQPGAVGQYCDQCEQGYWNYNEHGCRKCDCEADLSLGTVCDVQTGQCHCMDGATGPRCDQCIEGYLRIPEHGCRFCDHCVHVLVKDLDNLHVDIYKAESDLGSVSTVYLTSQRLSRINNTLASLKPSAEEMKKTSQDSALNDLKTNIGKTKSSADDISIKSKRHKATANKTEENAKKLEMVGTELDKDITKISNDVHNLVRSLEDLAANMGRQAITTERREDFLNKARVVLEELKQLDFSPLEASTKAHLAKTEEVLKKSLEKAKSSKDDQEKSKNLLETLKSFEEKLNEHRKNIVESGRKADLSEALNSRIKTDPFFSNGMSVDQKLDVCNENVKTARELEAKTNGLTLDIHDTYGEIAGMILNNSTKQLEAKSKNFDDELPVLHTLQGQTNQKTHQFELSADNLVRQFSSVKADSHRAVQAAESYKDIASSIKNAGTGSDEATMKSVEANSNSLGLQEQAKKSSEVSHALQLVAVNKSSIVKNDIEKGLEKAKSSINAINETVATNLATIRRASANADKLKSERQENTNAVINEAKELQKSLKETNEKIAEIAGKLPEMQEKARKSVSSSVSTADNVNLATTQTKHLQTSVPNTIDSVSSYTKKLNSLETTLKNVTAMVDDLRSKLAKARDLANRVKIGAHFYSNSSLQLQNPDKLSRTSAYSLISLYFKTTKQDGLLLFLGNEVGTARTLGVPTDDFMALEIVNGKVKLTYDLGSGATSISSSRFVSNGEWHKATIERTGQLAVLTVEGEGLVVSKNEGFSLGSKSVLNLHQDLSKFYIGGVPDAAKLPASLINRRFTGQIEEVYFHGQPLGLWNFALDGRVDTYGARERTELRRDITDTGVRLNGEGYVEMRRDSWIPRKETKIMLSFKTFASNGLLFYVGKERDYLSIEIRGGKVYAHYNLGSGSTNLTTPNSYNDGEWHNIEFDRAGKEAKLIMDMASENVLQATAPGNLADLDVTDVYYIGGLKYAVPQRDVTNQSFYGCIDKLKLNSQIMPNLNHHLSAAFVEVGCPDKPIRLVSFESSPGSVQFPPLFVSTKIEVTFKFKTHLKDALLLLITDENQMTTFAVTLESGTLVVTTITNGQGTLSRLKMEYKDYADGSWHYVTAVRDEKLMKLDVDDMFSENGELNAVGLLTQTEVILYFGKIPADKIINPQLIDRVVQPFVGCIGDVTFNQKLLDFTNATRTKTGVSMVGCPMADVVPSTSEAGVYDGSGNLVLENATSPKTWRPTPSPLDSCALDFGVPPTLSAADAQGSRFGLEPFSRLEFDKLPDTFDTKGEFSIQFRASAANGILFYATNEKRTDFISLYMKNGYLVFSFDSGSGPLSLQTKRRYLDYQWHTAVAWREGKNASVAVDGIVEVRGESSGTTFAVDTHRPFYVGGLPQELVPFSKKTVGGVSPVFGGCLRDFKLNAVELTEPAILHGVKPCSETMENGLYFGPDGGYAVLQEQFNVGTTFSFEMEMKPRVKDAILLSITAPGSKGDYLTLQMIDGNMKFIVDNGDGPQMVNLSLAQSNSVCDGHWHSVKIYKTKNLLTMSVDGVSKFFVIKQVKATETNTKDALYLGGIPQGHPNRGLETNEVFHGCIRGVIIGKKPRRKKDLEMKDLKVHGDVRYGQFCPVS